MVTGSRVTPDGVHVCVCALRCSESKARETVVSARICSGDVLEGGARSSRGVTCDGRFVRFTAVLSTF